MGGRGVSITTLNLILCELKAQNSAENMIN